MKKDKKGLFSKVIVIYCIAFISILTVASFVILALTGLDASGILGVAAGVFGGELLFLCMKRIFAKPSTPNNEDTKQEFHSHENTDDDDIVGGK